ncbi:MAG: universal stress protein [Micrococcaceae bacterium]|nr:universal stress protein [Micrococcaceae bacterium]
MNTGNEAQDKPVVVGVSPTSGSVAALLWGADEAARRSVELFAVSAWRGPRAPLTAGSRPPLVTLDPDDAFADAENELQRHVAEVLGDQPVTCRLIRGSALKVLQKVSRQAGLLVLDAPQRSDFSQSPLLAHRLVYQAVCPILIMPPALAHQPDTPLVRGTKELGRNLAKAAADAGRPGLRLPRDTDPDADFTDAEPANSTDAGPVVGHPPGPAT